MLDPERTNVSQRKKRKCPICDKPTAEDYKPFCSVRCQQVDLNRWLDGSYRIETNERPGEEAPSDPDDNR